MSLSFRQSEYYLPLCLPVSGEGGVSFNILTGTNPDISQKYKMGDISKGEANTLASQKIKKSPNAIRFRHVEDCMLDCSRRAEIRF